MNGLNSLEKKPLVCGCPRGHYTSVIDNAYLSLRYREESLKNAFSSE